MQSHSVKFLQHYLTHELRSLRNHLIKHLTAITYERKQGTSFRLRIHKTGDMEATRGMYSRLAGVSPDQDLDECMDSLLALPHVNPNQPREWLHIDPQGRTRYALVHHQKLVSGLTTPTGMLAACLWLTLACIAYVASLRSASTNAPTQ